MAAIGTLTYEFQISLPLVANTTFGAGAAGYVLALMTFIGAFDQLHIEFGILKELILIAFAGLALRTQARRADGRLTRAPLSRRT